MFFFLAACSQSPSGTQDDSGSSDDTATEIPTDDSGTTNERYVATGVTILDGTDIELPYDDLEALGPIVGDATLVGIGEPVHYSNDFAKVRARVIPWLVEERGFRAVAFEAPWFWADSGRPYIEDGKGELRDAMSSLGFDVWMSQPTAELIEWLHDWNLAHPDDKVTWFAYDIQWFPDDFPALRDIVRAADPAAEAELWKGVGDCLGGTYTKWTDFYYDAYGYGVYTFTKIYTEKQRVSCQVGLDAIQTWVTSNEDLIVAAVGDEGPTLADVALISLSAAQKEFAWWEDVYASFGARDEGMAAVLQRMWALRAPDERLVIWAHNAHLFRDAESLEYADYYYPNMGSRLDDALGDTYVPIAQLCSNTTYNWAGTGAVTVTPGPKSFEADIEALGPYTSLIVDVAAATAAGVLPDGVVEFGEPGRSVGVPADQMDAAIWLKASAELDVWDDW